MRDREKLVLTLCVVLFGWFSLACATASRHPEPKAAVERCNQALNEQSADSGVEKHQKVVAACMALFVDSVCRDGINEVDSGTRQKDIYRRCLPGYCSILTDTPALCNAGSQDMNPLTETVRKEEFFEKALFHDLGRDAFGLLDRRWVVLLSSTVLTMNVTHPQPIVVLPPTNRDETTTAGSLLFLTTEGEDAYLSLEGNPGERWKIPAEPGSEQSKSLEKALRGLTTLQDVNLHAGDEVPFSTVTWLIDMVVSIEKDARITFVLLK